MVLNAIIQIKMLTRNPNLKFMLLWKLIMEISYYFTNLTEINVLLMLKVITAAVFIKMICNEIWNDSVNTDFNLIYFI